MRARMILVVVLLVAAGCATAASPATATLEWRAIKDNPDGWDGTDPVAARRTVELRAAIQVDVVGGVVTRARSYFAVTCLYFDSTGTWRRHACSIVHEQDLWRGSTNVDHLEYTVPTSGDDGFYSRYGHWVTVHNCDRGFKASMNVASLGLAGEYEAPMFAESGTWYPRCEV